LERYIRLLGGEEFASINERALQKEISNHMALDLWGHPDSEREIPGNIPPLLGLIDIVRGLGGATNWSTGFQFPGDPKLNYSFFDGEDGSEILLAGISRGILQRGWASEEVKAAIQSRSPRLCDLLEKESIRSINKHRTELEN
jgi:hypothetical protein